jgi:uncharacterized membrane protein
MEQKTIFFLRLWHQIKVRPRLIFSLLAGFLLSFLLPAYLQPSTKALLIWDFGAGLYLILSFVMMFTTSLETMQKRARVQDDGALFVLGITIFAAIASLAAIIFELSGLEGRSGVGQSIHVLLVVGTFVISWLLVHLSFALHYAHLFYLKKNQTGRAILDIVGQEEPVYTDFLYFSIVIGMTFQTADIGLASSQMRRLAMTQGLIAFVFNASLLALIINIAAGLIH